MKLDYHHYSMTERAAGLASFGAVAAGQQAQRVAVHRALLPQPGRGCRARGVTEEFLDGSPGVLELNVEQWQRDFDEPEVQETLDDDNVLAPRSGPTEPAVVVSGPSGIVTLIETPTLAEIRGAIDEVSG